MPAKFEDFAKPSNDLLSDDYTSKFTLKCKKNAGSVGVTVESERSSEGSISSKIGTKFPYYGLKVDKLQFKPDGSYALETSLSPMIGTLMTFKGGKGSDLGLEYKKGDFLTTGTVDIKDMSKLSASSSIGIAPGVYVGGDLSYDVTGKGLSAFNVGGTYSSGPFFSCLTTTCKIAQVNAGVRYKVNDYLTLASSSTHTRAKPFDSFTFGGLYKASFGDVKAKVGSDGNVSACVKNEIVPKVTVTVSGTAPTSDLSKIKYGIGIIM